MAAGAASVWTDSPSDALPSHFNQNGLFFFLRAVSLGKSFINDWNKQMHALFCSGSESVSVCTAAEWLDLLWLKILKVWLEKGLHSFSLKYWWCLRRKTVSVCENVFMLQRSSALPSDISFFSLSAPALFTLNLLPWASTARDLKICKNPFGGNMGEMWQKCARFLKSGMIRGLRWTAGAKHTHTHTQLLTSKSTRSNMFFWWKHNENVIFISTQGKQGQTTAASPRVVLLQSKYTCYC